jgi:hypothetical protein
MIRYFKNTEINKTKWDITISKSYNRLPFALSWYLDIVSPNWDALIFGDYEEIMPITKRTKFGITYLCQPILCPRLGVFSTIKSHMFCVDDYMIAITSKFKKAEIALNEKNFISTSIHHSIKTEVRFSQEQRFESAYSDIQNKYSKSHKKNINKFINDSTCEVIKASSYLDFFQYKNVALKEIGFRWDKYNKRVYLEVIKKLSEKGKIEIFYGVDEFKKVIGGICLLKYDFDRYSFQTFSTNIGRRNGLVFFLIDKIFNENSDKIIDFMGSSIPGIRYRNMGFDCSEIEYNFIKMNRLISIFTNFKS